MVDLVFRYDQLHGCRSKLKT